MALPMDKVIIDSLNIHCMQHTYRVAQKK